MTLRPPHHPEQFRVKVGRYGDRWYIDTLPADGTWEPMTDPVPSVTTVKNAWPKGALPKWYAGQAAKCAVAEHDTWKNMEHQAAVDYIAAAPNRNRDRAAGRGGAIHAIIEGRAEGHTAPMFVESDVEPYLEAIDALLADLGAVEPVAVETVAIKRGELGYGGTLDAIWHVPSLGGTWLFDWKSRKPGAHTNAYEEEAAQLVAYACADYLIADVDGAAARVPVPHLDGLAIVAIAPDGYRIHPVKEG
jgi:hypothetical protein